MKKIDFMIIGVQKAATTSLGNYLGQHPEICKHKSEEMPYFTIDEEYNLGYNLNFKKYFHHCKSNQKILAKSVTVIQSKNTIMKVYQHNPNMKIIVLLRNPIDRAYSAFWYAKRMGWEYLDTFEEAIKNENNRIENKIVQRNIKYIKNGEYAKQLQILFTIFPRNQVYIVLQEDLAKNANQVCQDIFSFFGISSYKNLNLKRSNEASMPKILFISKILHSNSPIKKKIKQSLPLSIQRFIDRLKEKIISINEKKVKIKKMDPKTREYLANYYFKMNKDLEKIINRDLSSWS